MVASTTSYETIDPAGSWISGWYGFSVVVAFLFVWKTRGLVVEGEMAFDAALSLEVSSHCDLITFECHYTSCESL